MKLVIVESPYKGDVARNLFYLERCLRHSVYRGESPYASHKMLTTCLDDGDPEERKLGIAAGLAWKHVMTGAGDPVLHVFYTDLGWSEGMLLAKADYEKSDVPFECRTLPESDAFFQHEVAATVLIQNGPLVFAVSRKDDPNDWGLPGGKVEPWETPAVGASRELYEETGVLVPPPDLVEVFRGPARTTGRECITYRAPDWAAGAASLGYSKEDGAAVGWVFWEDLERGSFGEYNRALRLQVKHAGASTGCAMHPGASFHDCGTCNPISERLQLTVDAARSAMPRELFLDLVRHGDLFTILQARLERDDPHQYAGQVTAWHAVERLRAEAYRVRMPTEELVAHAAACWDRRA